VLGPIWNSFYPWPFSALGRAQERWTHWFYRNVPFWTPSQCTADILTSRGVKLVKVLINGTYSAALPVLPEKVLESPLRLAVVSRLAPNKRIDHAIRVVKRLVDAQVDARLAVVGTGEAEPQLRQLVGELGLAERVVFTGPLSEAAKDEQLGRAHLLLHTSLREGWGLNVIEANAVGTPAVVYPVGGLVESTLHERTGLVTERETPESMAAAIISLLTTPGNYDKYRVNAWKRAADLHWDRVLPEACDWLEEQARGQRPRPG
jgi:glycosyltransferase involved in cell wall biosynthesis